MIFRDLVLRDRTVLDIVNRKQCDSRVVVYSDQHPKLGSEHNAIHPCTRVLRQGSSHHILVLRCLLTPGPEVPVRFQVCTNGDSFARDPVLFNLRRMEIGTSSRCSELLRLDDGICSTPGSVTFAPSCTFSFVNQTRDVSPGSVSSVYSRRYHHLHSPPPPEQEVDLLRNTKGFGSAGIDMPMLQLHSLVGVYQQLHMLVFLGAIPTPICCHRIQ